MSASRPVVRIGVGGARPDDGAGDRAGMAFLAEPEDDVGERALRRRRDHVGRARSVAPPCACRAVRRGGTRSRALPLSSCIEETPRSSTTPSAAAIPRLVAVSSSAEKRLSATVSRPPAASTRPAAERHRALIAIETQHLAIRRRENRTRIAAGAERAVDIDAAGANAEMLDDRPDEHGNVAGRSASDVRISGVAARHHSRAPSSEAGRSEPRRVVSVRTVAVAFARCAPKRCGSQI